MAGRVNAWVDAARDPMLDAFDWPSQLLYLKVLRRPLEPKQYASLDYREALDQAGIMCSMSRRGNCWDNAVVESFFSTLRAELVDHRSWRTRAEARTDLVDHIEVFYNRKRRHSSISSMSPHAYEEQYLSRMAA